MVYSKVVDKDTDDIINYCGSEMLLSNLMDSTFLVTGASGMIGSYIIYTLLKLNKLYNANINIKVVVRNPEKLDEYIKTDESVEVIVQDIINDINVYGPVDYILHAASPASPKIMSKFPVETNLANTIGTANTLKLALKKQSKAYLFISSREIYGEPNPGQEIFTEDGPLGQVDPLVPRNGYAEGKKAAENMCSSFKEQYNLNTKIVRLAHTYGPGMSIYDGRVQADFLNNIIHNQDIVLKSDGSSVRTYTYIADAIKAMFLVLFKSNDIVYNIADEDSKTSIRELAETLIDLEQHKGLNLVFDIPETENKGTSSFKTGILSTDKIRKELGWAPAYSIRDGFARTIEHLHEELLIESKSNSQRKH